MKEWIYKGEELAQVPGNAFGFIYCITNVNSGQKYIGRKQFVTQKGVETNWKTYFGSSMHLSKDVEKLGKKCFLREIISVHSSNSELCEAEVTEQENRNVLYEILPNGERAYYNRCIKGKEFYINMLEKWQDPEYRKHQEEMHKETWKNPDYRKRMSDAHKGQVQWNLGLKGTQPVTEELRAKRRKLSRQLWNDPVYRENCLNACKSEDRRKKLSDAHKGKKWITNGSRSVLFRGENLPEGYRYGRKYSPNSL